MPSKNWLGGESDVRSDGVVEYASAHMDDAVSEVLVNCEHQHIQRDPKAIIEVRRVLLSHLNSVQREERIAQRLAAQQNKDLGVPRLPVPRAEDSDLPPVLSVEELKAQPESRVGMGDPASGLNLETIR